MKKNNLFYVVATACVMVFAACSTKSGHDLGNSAEGDDADLIAQKNNLPYTIKLEEYVNPAFPNLHSFTHATYNDKLVMFGGRQRGLHSPNYNFGQNAANKTIYVIDTHSWSPSISTWSVYSQADSLTVQPDTNKVTNSSSNFANIGQFRANNAEFFTNNNVLYVIGGLLGGTTNCPQGPVTQPYMTAINLEALVNAVMQKTFVPQGQIRQFSDPNLAITGGEVGTMNNTVYLAFGWNYNNQTNGLYTHMVSTLTYTDVSAGKSPSLNVAFNSICSTCRDNWNNSSDSGNFRRRDGSMSPIIDPKDQSPALMYYAGVFKAGATNFDTPVWIHSNSVAEESGFHMRGNIYTCMVVPFYSQSRKESYATLLGGITNVKYNIPPAKQNAPVLLNENNAPLNTPDPTNLTSVPFSNRITTIKIDKQHNMYHFLMPDSFPATKYNIEFPTPAIKGVTPTLISAPASLYNGAESEIFWTVPQNLTMGNGVIDLDAFMKQNPNGGSVGYLFGGILSRVPNLLFVSQDPLKQSIASNRLFSIIVVPLKK